MASPINSNSICDLVPSSTSTVCQRVKAALIEIPSKLCEFFSWMFDASGNFTEAFKFMIASIIYSPGDFKDSGTSVQPAGWLICDGAEVSRTTYDKLFANIGTTFGAGDGATTFNLPDFRGRCRIGAGQGDGLTARAIGEQDIGAESHAVEIAELPPHHHPVTAKSGLDIDTGSTRTLAGSGTEFTESMDTGDTGGGQAISLMQPSAVAYVYVFTGKFS